MIIKYIDAQKFIIGRCIYCNTHFTIKYENNKQIYHCPKCKREFILARSR